ncbi:Cupin domain-containing protein [Actinophytocola oryzae]|uniref:Cupin domain-containing protein n=1 Tax=Actinophytocola oryzae TaxID=502181 RepID=A0A4R7UWH1_9PSEU|nr:Cupin domain-containing protein [Actinophytocola oryzae]
MPPFGLRVKISSERSAAGSLFEAAIPVGFDVGAHVHRRSEEFFYVLRGEVEIFAFEPVARTGDDWHAWRSPEGEGVVRAAAGTVVHVPPGIPHGFSNPGPEPARLLLHTAPPAHHEDYFDELLALLAARRGDTTDEVRALRERYDIEQLTPLRSART